MRPGEVDGGTAIAFGLVISVVVNRQTSLGASGSVICGFYRKLENHAPLQQSNQDNRRQGW